MSRIPVVIITGFLGSGKTTLLNHLLMDPALADTAVIINEFGEVSLDHLLVETALENTLVLQSGCICCTIRGDLVDTLNDLIGKRDRREIPSFSRILIETTGLADPAPVIQTLASDPLVSGLFTLSGLVTSVDCVNGAGQLESFPEASKQIALADLLILTKSDLATRAEIEALKAKAARMNPAASQIEVINGAIAPATLFDCVLDPSSHPEKTRQWLSADSFETTPDHHHHHPGHTHNDPNRHGADIRAFCITLDEKITRTALEKWLSAITSLRGADLLRIKGLFNVAGEPGAIVVHAVQHLVHPVVRLPHWPDEADPRSRVVFITRNIPEAALRNSLLALIAA